MKIASLLLPLFIVPYFICAQVQTSIDVVGSFDFTNIVYLSSSSNIRGNNGNPMLNRGGRQGFRFGLNANILVLQDVWFKSGLRYAIQGHLSDILISHPDKMDLTKLEVSNSFYDEYYIEIPFIFRYQLGEGKVSYFIELGASSHYYLKSKQVFEHVSFFKAFNGEITSTIPADLTLEDIKNDQIPYLRYTRFRLAYIFGLGVNYNISKDYQLFIQSTLRYFRAVRTLEDLPIEERVLATKNAGIEIGVRRKMTF